MWEQKTGTKVEITTESQQRLIVNAGVWVDYTNKYNLEIPQNTSLSVSGIAAVNRMKNLNMCSYIAFKGSVSISGYTADYVFPINCSVGLMDFQVDAALNMFWYLVGGGTSTAARPAPTLAAGVSYAFCTNFTSVISLLANGTGVRWVGSLKDLPRITVYLSIQNCSNATGNLSDLIAIPGYLNTQSDSGLTGNISSLRGLVTGYLIITNCNYTGVLSSLAGNISTNFSMINCSGISGVYTPISNTKTPTTFNVTNSGMSASDVANTLIACDQVGLVKNGVTFTYTGLTIDATGMVAAYDLRDNHAWTFSPALP